MYETTRTNSLNIAGFHSFLMVVNVKNLKSFVHSIIDVLIWRYTIY